MATNVKRALLLMNLGSPDSTKVKDVRKYLNEFLMDGRVIDIPYIVRALLVRGIIVPFRAPKSAEAYRSIWTDEGSPLIVLTKQLQEALQIPGSTLSHHISALMSAGIISQRREGRVLYCVPDYELLQGLVHFLQDQCCSEQ